MLAGDTPIGHEGRTHRRSGARRTGHEPRPADPPVRTEWHGRARVEARPDPWGFYSVPMFVAEPDDPSIVRGRGAYGMPFVSFVQHGNVFGAQCHPEKSSTEGLALLRNFARICSSVAAAS